MLCRQCHFRFTCMPASASDRELPAFERSVRQFKLVQKQTLVHEGDQFESYYAVLQGVLKGYVTSSTGNDNVSRFAYPGDLVGLGAMSGNWPKTLTALDEARVCRIPIESVNTPTLRRRLIKLTADRLRDIYDFELTLTSASTRSKRLARFLVKAERHLPRSSSEGTFRLPMSQRDIGSYLALSTESINRAFRDLETRGLIKHHRKEVQILRRGPLTALANDNDRLY